MIKAVIFDMDGLFIDSEPMHHAVWNSIAKEYGVEIGEETYKGFVGIGSHAVTNYIIENGENTEDATHESLRAKKLERNEEMAHIAKPRPGAKELVKELREKYAVGLASTSRKKTVNLLLETTGTQELFQTKVGGDEVENIKPAPDLYLRAAEKLSVKPEECVALEDSATGVEAAKNAGMKCIAVPNEYTIGSDFSKADWIVENFEQAGKVMKQYSKRIEKGGAGSERE